MQSAHTTFPQDLDTGPKTPASGRASPSRLPTSDYLKKLTPSLTSVSGRYRRQNVTRVPDVDSQTWNQVPRSTRSAQPLCYLAPLRHDYRA